jgi:hypothetical protein
MFRIGEKVVCSKSIVYSNNEVELIKKDNLYTIKNIMYKDYTIDRIKLDEIDWTSFDPKFFIPLTNLRKQKIKKICLELEKK